MCKNVKCEAFNETLRKYGECNVNVEEIAICWNTWSSELSLASNVHFQPVMLFPYKTAAMLHLHDLTCQLLWNLFSQLLFGSHSSLFHQCLFKICTILKTYWALSRPNTAFTETKPARPLRLEHFNIPVTTLYQKSSNIFLNYLHYLTYLIMQSANPPSPSSSSSTLPRFLAKV